MQGRLCNENPGKLWTGVVESKSVTGVRKPDVLNSFDWQELDWCWRSELLTFIPFSVCSPTPELRTPITLPPSWYESLRTSLENLGQYETDRMNTRQELISRRILEWFGPEIDSKIEYWSTVHGDIHWANLTCPECWIFDWEAWGRGPKGLDAAFLLCFSLLQPNIAAQIFHYFEDWLTAPDGIRSQLFACAELLRMIKLYGDHPDLASKLTELAERLVNQAPRT
jgi:hypothetical protein